MACRRACWSSTWSSSRIATSSAAATGPTFAADRGDIGHRLDQAVLRHLPGGFGLSRAALQKLIVAGRVLVNGRPARRPAQRLGAGDVVSVDAVAASPPQPPQPEVLPIAVVYDDGHLVVVNKPAGMVAHPTALARSGTVVNALLGRRRAPDWTPRLVQRLDRGTTGLMTVAGTAAIHTALQRDHARVVKEYLALVWGRPSPRRGRIELPLGRDPLDRRRMMARDDGAPSRTAYDVVAYATGRHRGLSLVRCRLETGRTHQIRVHLAAAGWPLVGDPVYGRAPQRRLAHVMLDRLARAFDRQALHAWRLTLTHPVSGETLSFEAPLPDDLDALLRLAGLTRRPRHSDGHAVPPEPRL